MWSQNEIATLENGTHDNGIASGVDIVTLPFYVFEEMLCHKKTSQGVAKFLQDAPEEYKDLFK